jgi:hypothetical protein
VQQSENTVQTDPYQSNKHNAVVVFYYDIGLTGLDVIALKLFLASGTFQDAGKETQSHLDYEHDEDNHDGYLLDESRTENVDPVNDLMDNIVIEQNQKNDYSDYKPDIMINADFCYLYVSHFKPLK